MKLVFVRHGDPCRENYLLTPKGEEESRLLGTFFNGQDIEKIFSSQSPRARETVNFFLKTFCNGNSSVNVQFVDWLSEFKHKVILPSGVEQFAWEMPLDFWCSGEGMLNLETCMDNPIYLSGNIKEHAEKIWFEFDEVLKNTGYCRAGNYYRLLQRGNKDTFLFFSHFATISVLLAHILNIPLSVMLHFFWQAPSAFTTLRSEELEEGKVIFRCIGYNEMRHLEKHSNLKSFYGLKPETFDSAWRD